MTKEPKIKNTNTPRDLYERNEWGALWTLKINSKKGWGYYKFTLKEINRIKIFKPDWI